MKLQYLAHSAFLLTTDAGLRIAIDPWRNPGNGRWFVREFPLTEADLLIVTHDHFDHDAAYRITGLPTVMRHALEMKLGDLRLTSYADWHVPGHSSAGLENLIVVLESGLEGAPVRVCHLGDNRFPPAPAIVEAIGTVDLLIVPVDDSRHLLSFDEVDGFVRMFEPSVVIPVHYDIPGITAPESTLGPADGWLERQARVRRVAGPVSLSPDTLPGESEIWLMTPELD
ncbi:MAG: MBL fold metallo-hydrolase [Thermomicrobiales bacterium]